MLSFNVKLYSSEVNLCLKWWFNIINLHSFTNYFVSSWSKPVSSTISLLWDTKILVTLLFQILTKQNMNMEAWNDVILFDKHSSHSLIPSAWFAQSSFKSENLIFKLCDIFVLKFSWKKPKLEFSSRPKEDTFQKHIFLKFLEGKIIWTQYSWS